MRLIWQDVVWGCLLARSDPDQWTVLSRVGTNAPGTPPSEADDFNPGSGIFAAFMIMIMVMVVVFMLLVSIGLAVGIGLCALAGALAALGILSSSVAIGFIRRSPASGFRALFLQLGAVAGVPCGIGAAWLVSLLAHSHWSVATRVVVGGAGGLMCGVLVACLFNLVRGKVAAWILARYDRRPHREQRVEVVDA